MLYPAFRTLHAAFCIQLPALSTPHTGHSCVKFINTKTKIILMLAQHTRTENNPETTESSNPANSTRGRILFNKAFFGKTSCLKVTQNTLGEVYFHFGLDNKGWTWKKVKFNDTELSEIISVINGKKESIAFFHNFNEDKTQIWITRKEEQIMFKTKHASRTLTQAEAGVLEILLKHFIITSCMV